MFGTIYSKAIELFGKAFLVSAFVPTMIVTAALAFTLAPEWSHDTLVHWTASTLNEQFAGALLLLLLLYLVAFVFFGIRDRITRFLSAGEFWGFASIRRRRRIKFTQEILDAQEAQLGAAAAVANATLWSIGGFNVDDLDKRFVYLPKGTKAKSVFRELRRWLRWIEGQLRHGNLVEKLSAARRVAFAGLFLALHRGAILDPERTRLIVKHLRELCAAADPPIDMNEWCKQVQQLDYAELVAAFDRNLWAPPPRNVQPTALGNILIWAAVYSAQRYGIELDFLYPRLQRVIDKDYQAKIDDRQQFFDFTVLLAFLSFAGGLVFAGMSAWRLTAEHHWRDWREVVSAAAFTAAFFVLGRIAYNLSLVAARGYVSMLTSAIDLFRLQLLKELSITLKDPSQEPETWRTLNTSIQKAKP